jgi:hypothetical protein
MEVEIIFMSASTPKIIDAAVGPYTKGNLLCVEDKNGMILKYPLCNIFSVSHKHQKHNGSNQKEQSE